MHPYHFHSMGPWRRGPSRLVWFLIGAATATWWLKRKDTDRRIFGHCMRPSIQSSPSQSTDSSAPPPTNPGWPQSLSEIPRVINNIPQVHSSPTPSSPAPLVEWEKRQEQQWDLEKEHIARISRQATDAMVDLTEATLESVLSTAESLKAKLAEHRAQREKQQAVVAQRLEEERRNPPRLV